MFKFLISIIFVLASCSSVVPTQTVNAYKTLYECKYADEDENELVLSQMISLEGDSIDFYKLEIRGEKAVWLYYPENMVGDPKDNFGMICLMAVSIREEQALGYY